MGTQVQRISYRRSIGLQCSTIYLACGVSKRLKRVKGIGRESKGVEGSEAGSKTGSMKVTKNSVVYLRYRLEDDRGEVLEDNLGEAAVAVLQGQGNVIPGLDRSLLGRVSGERYTVQIPPDLGYGPRQDNHIQRVSKKYFNQPHRLKPGMQTQLQTEQGRRTVTVHKVGGKVIDVDMNHPLAGMHLNFSVEIDVVREATPTEIAHRHAHADGHDHH